MDSAGVSFCGAVFYMSNTLITEFLYHLVMMIALLKYRKLKWDFQLIYVFDVLWYTPSDFQGTVT